MASHNNCCEGAVLAAVKVRLTPQSILDCTALHFDCNGSRTPVHVLQTIYEHDWPQHRLTHQLQLHTVASIMTKGGGRRGRGQQVKGGRGRGRQVRGSEGRPGQNRTS